jgi:hypothetical protein
MESCGNGFRLPGAVDTTIDAFDFVSGVYEFDQDLALLQRI